MNIERLKEVLTQARSETGKVIIGQHDVVDKALIAIFTGNHALIEGVPGVAKTLLVRTLAQVLGCEFSRIQFTPDLMPADITGTNVFNLQRNEFSLIKGPIFTSFLLADEINRAPARHNRRCFRRCKSDWSPLIATRILCRGISPFSQRKTRLSTKALIRSLKRKRTASC